MKDYKFIRALNQLLLLVILCTFLSCKSSDEHQIPTTFDDKTLASLSLQGKEFGLSDHLFSPFRVKLLDSVLIVSDYGGNPLLVAYDLKHQVVIKKFGSKGRGPGEFLSAWNVSLSKSDSAFSVYDPILKKMVQYTLSDRIPTYLNEIYLNNEDFFIYANWLSPTKIAYTTFSPKGRLAIYDVNQENISFFQHSTPPNTKSAPESVHSHSYHATVETTTSGDKIAVCSRYADQIELYKSDGEKIATIVGPEGFTPIYNIVENNGSPSMAETGSTKLAYLDIACTDKFIYALYSGKNHKDYPGLLIEHGQTVYVFNWEGEPVKKILLDKGITSMGVSEEGSFLYGTSMLFDELVDVLYYKM